MEWHPAGWSVWLPLLIFPCTIKSRSSLLASAYLGGPETRALKRLWWWWWCVTGESLAMSFPCKKGKKWVCMNNSFGILSQCWLQAHAPGVNITHCTPAVCLSIFPVPEPKSRRKSCRMHVIVTKAAHRGPVSVAYVTWLDTLSQSVIECASTLCDISCCTS